MKRIRQFFSPTRIKYIMFGLILGIAFFGSALWLVPVDSPWNGLMLNLAAAALEVPLIASILDFWRERNREIKVDKARVLATENINNIDFSLILNLANVFGFSYDFNDSIANNSSDLFSEYKRSAIDYVEAINFEQYRLELSESDLEKCLLNFKRSHDQLTELIGLFGFALNDELKGAILQLRQDLGSLISVQEISITDKAGKKRFLTRFIKEWAKIPLAHMKDVRNKLVS